MTTATEPDISPTNRVVVRPSRPAVWALACGVYAGALGAGVSAVVLPRADIRFPSEVLLESAARNGVLLAVVGGTLGSLAGPFVWLIRPRRLPKTLALFLLGPIWGALGCGLAAFATILLHDHLHPTLSSALAMTAVGTGVGYVGCRLSSRWAKDQADRSRSELLAGLGWGFSVAATTGAAWLSGCIFAYFAFGIAPPFELTAFEGVLLVGCGAVYGAAGGALVGACRTRTERNDAALTLGFLGAIFGALAGIATAGTFFFDRPYPLLTSTLALSVIGFAAGLSGHQFRPAPAPDEPLDGVDEPDAPAVRIEWLLRESKRPWRVSRPLLRVLPVVTATAATLVWGAVASNAALYAVAALGAVVAHALYRQEERLDALERRSISERDTRPPV